jgi:hypothetical protein
MTRSSSGRMLKGDPASAHLLDDLVGGIDPLAWLGLAL